MFSPKNAVDYICFQMSECTLISTSVLFVKILINANKTNRNYLGEIIGYCELLLLIIIKDFFNHIYCCCFLKSYLVADLVLLHQLMPSNKYDNFTCLVLVRTSSTIFCNQFPAIHPFRLFSKTLVLVSRAEDRECFVFRRRNVPA